MRDALAAVAGADPDAPHRPDRQVVDMRNSGGAREWKFGPRRDGRPADHLMLVVGEDTRRDRAAAELLDVFTASLTGERTVGLGVDPVT